MLGFFKTHIWIIVALVIAATSNSFAKSIEEILKDCDNNTTIEMKNKSPLRYPGGKTRACKPLDIILNEISYDLLENQDFSIQPRSEKMMPMPFVTNDAIIISKKLKI